MASRLFNSGILGIPLEASNLNKSSARLDLKGFGGGGLDPNP